MKQATNLLMDMQKSRIGELIIINALLEKKYSYSFLMLILPGWPVY